MIQALIKELGNRLRHGPCVVAWWERQIKVNRQWRYTVIRVSRCGGACWVLCRRKRKGVRPGWKTEGQLSWFLDHWGALQVSWGLVSWSMGTLLAGVSYLVTSAQGVHCFHWILSSSVPMITLGIGIRSSAIVRLWWNKLLEQTVRFN